MKKMILCFCLLALPAISHAGAPECEEAKSKLTASIKVAGEKTDVYGFTLQQAIDKQELDNPNARELIGRLSQDADQAIADMEQASVQVDQLCECNGLVNEDCAFQ